MATPASVHQSGSDKNRSDWHQAFTPQMARQLAYEDSVALRNVCVVLLTIVSGGLLLGIAAVLLATS